MSREFKEKIIITIVTALITGFIGVIFQISKNYIDEKSSDEIIYYNENNGTNNSIIIHE